MTRKSLKPGPRHRLQSCHLIEVNNRPPGVDLFEEDRGKQVPLGVGGKV